jgi:hypothetical protein
MLLLLVQPFLIRAHRNDLHRRIGKTVFVFAPPDNELHHALIGFAVTDAILLGLCPIRHP